MSILNCGLGDHPLRAIRLLVNEALAALTSEFAALYAPIGRPSIPAEKLLRAMLLQAFCSIRSERQLMERLEFDLLFRWFVGVLGIDDAVWDHSVFSKNHDRLLEGEIVAKFLNAILAQPRVKRLLSAEHVSVDGTLIEAWASMKSFKPKDGANDPPAKGGGRKKRRISTARSGRTKPTAHERSRSAALSQRDRQGGETLLYRSRADGEPARALRRRLPDAGGRTRRTHRGASYDRAARGSTKSDHAGRRYVAPLPVANWSVAGGSSRPIFGIETISISVAPPPSSLARGARRNHLRLDAGDARHRIQPVLHRLRRGPDLMRAMKSRRRDRRTSR